MLVLGMCVLLAGCSSGSTGRPDQEPTPHEQSVRVVRATHGTLYPALSLAGTIAPFEVVALSNALSEPAATVDVQEGDHVHAGQTLADLDVDDLQAQLTAALQTAQADNSKSVEAVYNARLTFAQAPNSVKEAQAQLVQTQRTFREAQRNRDRIEMLAKQGYIPAQNLDEQQVVLANDEQAVLQADAALQTALATQNVEGNPAAGLQASTIAESRQEAAAQYASAAQIQREISRAHIVSPVDGIVVNRNLNPGEYPSGRQIFTIEANDTVFAVLTASAVQAYQIHARDRVSMHSPGLGRATFEGTVATLLDAATPGSTNFTIKVAIPNRAGVLRAGTPVRAVIALRPVSGTIVPASAFSDDQRSRVIVVRQRRAQTRPVTEIATDGAASIVDGIEPGDDVVRDGSQSVSNNERVAIER